MESVDLEKMVWKEEDVLELLGLTRGQLDVLRRERYFPCVNLNQRTRVYLATDVYDYLKKTAERQTQG